MKLFLALVFIVGSYLGFMFYTTDVVFDQADHLKANYQYVADHSEELATGQPAAETSN